MKKQLLCLVILFTSTVLVSARSSNFSCSPLFLSAFTAGYVFKEHDALFRDVYGLGMGNVITADGMYQPWKHIGIGAKISYWIASGHTTFLQRKSWLQEVPMTLYLKGIADLCNGLRLYASVGGGAAWLKEESYLGHVKQFRGIGEAEIGINYSMKRRVNFTSALRYIFPRQSQGINKANVGGVDLRAGIGIVF